MRIAKLIIALTLHVCGCAAAPEPIVEAEHAVAQNEQQLELIKDSYDLSEQNLERTRLGIFELVNRGRVVSQQLEIAAHDFQMASAHNYLAGDQFIRAAASYQRAANTYRQIASFIILIASSGRLLDALCKQSTSVHRYSMMLDAFGVKLADKNVEKLIPRILGPQNIEHPEPDKHTLDMPLPVMNVLVKRAAEMLLCAKERSFF